MRLTLAHIGNRLAASDPFETLTQMWLERMGNFAEAESMAYRSTEAFFESLARTKKGGTQVLVLLDSRGKQMSSEEFAAWLGARRDSGVAQIVFAIGPASGWDDIARKQAALLLSLSKMTLAHALARAVLAEQIYRATTILTGHPYHTGH
jgi:23S rRNA (pseudouridine1915-N3)-methyltransferase